MPRVSRLTLAMLCLGTALPALAQTAPLAGPGTRPPVLSNPDLAAEVRASDIVGRLTLDEKAAQLGADAPAIPRLGIPAYNWWNEGLHGVARADNATVFPQAIGMAASWDTGLIERMGDRVGTEFRAKFKATLQPDGSSAQYRGLTIWSPNINIFRDPRWGRGQETYGEDPFLTGRIAVAYVHGLQGNDPDHLKVSATAKHFAVHSGPETTRHKIDVTPTPHDLEDTYLPAFRTAVTEGHVESVMCAYNAVDDVPACASHFLLAERLRRDWGFRGHVVTDCGAAANIYRPDALHYRKTPEEAVTAGFEAGMDVICGDYRNNMTTEPGSIANAVRAGLLPESVIDVALRRLFVTRIKLGLFDPPARAPFGDIKADAAPDDPQLARAVADETMVLLKNDGLLPLKTAPRRIAVVGPTADSLDVLIGNYNGTPAHPVTILAGIKGRWPGAQVTYVEGTGLVAPTNGDKAVAAARNADLVVFAGGLSARVEGEEMRVEAEGFNGGDRTGIDLPKPQQALLERVVATGKPVVLVLTNGSALSVNWADAHVGAILEAWYPGEQGGNAVAGVLAGDTNPAGRLPVTFYRSLDGLPAFDDYGMAGRTYRYHQGEVLYPFGHGLSFTHFAYSGVSPSQATVDASGAVTISATVTNAGERDGDEVVQLYLSRPGLAGAPIRQLAGFQRIALKEGETRTVHFTLSGRALSTVDAAGNRKIVAGPVDVWVGGGQPIGRAGLAMPAGGSTRFAIEGERALPK
jgi:beta-glucosidase